MQNFIATNGLQASKPSWIKSGYTKLAGDKLVSWSAALSAGDLRFRRGLRPIGWHKNQHPLKPTTQISHFYIKIWCKTKSHQNPQPKFRNLKVQLLTSEDTTGVPDGAAGLGGAGGACGAFPATTAASHSASLSRVFPKDPSLSLALMVDRRCGRVVLIWIRPEFSFRGFAGRRRSRPWMGPTLTIVEAMS